MKPDLNSLIEKTKNELFNMELRGNTLLSLGIGEKILEITEGNTEVAFRRLVEQKKTMHFVPRTVEGDKNNLHALSLSELPLFLSGESVENQAEGLIKTELSRKKLEKTLLSLSNEANLLLHQKSCDCLYLATGFLTWYEDINSFKPRHAPLVLIPVELYRESVNDVYHLKYTGGDLRANDALAAKLQQSLDFELPLFNTIGGAHQVNSSADLDVYFDNVSGVIAKKARWMLDKHKMSLGFFAVAKQALFYDLFEQSWEGEGESHLVGRLCEYGFSEDKEKCADVIKNAAVSKNTHYVFDADASQVRAIEAAKLGANIAINGASGSGKSQTLINIIAEAVHQQKSVLVVSERLSELNHLYALLALADLGDHCLPLFSQHAISLSLMKEIKRCLHLTALPPDTSSELEQGFTACHDTLETYNASVNIRIGKTQFNFQQALGYYHRYLDVLKGADVALDPLTEGDLDFSIWDTEHYTKASGKIDEVVQYLQEHGIPNNNAFSSTNLITLDAGKLEQGRRIVEQIIALHIEQKEHVQALAQEMGLVSELLTGNDVNNMVASLVHLKKIPDLSGVNADAIIWDKSGDRIIALAEEGRDIQQCMFSFSGTFIEAAYNYDWTHILDVFTKTGQKWWRFLSSDYRSAKQTYEGMCRHAITGDVNDWIGSIRRLIGAKRNQESFTSHARVLLKVIGNHYQGLNTDWEHLNGKLRWIDATRKGLVSGVFDEGVAFYLIAKNRRQIDQTQLQTVLDIADKINHNVEEIAALFHLDKSVFQSQYRNLAMNNIYDLLTDLSLMDALVLYNQLSDDLNKLHCHRWSKLAGEWHANPTLLQPAFQYNFFYLLLMKQYKEQAALQEFDADEYGDMFETLQDMTIQLQVKKRRLILAEHVDRLGLLPYEEGYDAFLATAKQDEDGMAIRRLLHAYPELTQKVKPIFLMSPLEVTKYLPTQKELFDLVVIEGAHRTAFSKVFGSVLRGKQLVLSGDTQQHGAIEFNTKSLETNDAKSEIEGIPSQKNVMALFMGAGLPEMTLKWHYRSQTTGLFDFMNKTFYKGHYRSFSTPTASSPNKGLIVTQIQNGTFDNVETFVNRTEAKIIGEQVMRHARETPHLSLGVIAFNSQHRDFILAEIEKARKEHPALESFFIDKPADTFFVAKINEVSAEVRDCIFVSLGFGKNIEGQIVTSFGCLSKSEGDKWLNSALTRARRTTEFFTSLTRDDLAMTGNSAEGINAIMALIDWYEAKAAIATPLIEPHLVPFQTGVIAVINGMGYDVDFISSEGEKPLQLAVKSLLAADKYLLLVDCDCVSADYSPSLLDREYLRKKQYRQQGWTLHTIWSVNWFRQTSLEIEKLTQAIKQAENASLVPDNEMEKTLLTHSHEIHQYRACELRELSLKNGDVLSSISTPTLVNEISKIIEIESPIHIKQLALRLLSAVSVTETNKDIHRAILAAVAQLVKQGRIEVENEFLLLSGNQIKARHRGELPFNEYKFEFVYDGEITDVAILALKNSQPMSKHILMQCIGNELGFSTQNKAVQYKIDETLTQMVLNNRLRVENELFSLG